MGLIRGNVRLSSPAHACHFRHALALDECRVKFLPEYFYGTNSQIEDARSSNSPDDEYVATFAERGGSVMSDDGAEFSCDEEAADIKEVWFPGYHSDV